MKNKKVEVAAGLSFGVIIYVALRIYIAVSNYYSSLPVPPSPLHVVHYAPPPYVDLAHVSLLAGSDADLMLRYNPFRSGMLPDDGAKELFSGLPDTVKAPIK